MLEFSISNQLLSRLDATKVVADSENYLECSFQFSGDWDGTVAVATFGHSQVTSPISVRIVDGKCQVPHEVIKSHGFQLSVYGTVENGGAMCHIPTNVVTVEVEASGTGQGVGPTTPTKSLYDSLMTAITAGEKAASEAKTSALASAEMAEDARKEAVAAQRRAQSAEDGANTSAASCAADAAGGRAVWEMARVLGKQVQATAQLCMSYAVGSGIDRQVSLDTGIVWEEGAFVREWMNLDPAQRYRVRVNDTWYDVITQWELVEESRTTGNEQAELSGTSRTIIDDGEIPETPGGEEVNPGGGGGETPTDPIDPGEGEEPGGGGDETPETPGDGTSGDGTGSGTTGGDGTTGGGDETPETPGGEEVNPGGDGGGSSSVPVLNPIKSYVKKKDIVKLVAGPVTVEDVRMDQEKNQQMICRMTTMDSTVREVEIRTDGNVNAKYCYEQAMAAAARAEAAAARAEARG